MKKMKNINVIKSLKYIGLAYLISWTCWLIIIFANRFGYLKYGTLYSMILLTIGVCGPPISIIALLIKWKEIRSLKDFMEYIFKGRNYLRSAIVTLIFCLIFFTGVNYCFPILQTNWYYFLLDIPCMMFGGGFEEIGWRGFLLLKLEEITSNAAAPLLLGVIWAFWHIPLWFISGTTQSSRSFLAFLFMCICWTATLSLLRKYTDNIFCCIFLHAWINVLFDMYYINYDFSSRAFWVFTVIQGIISYVIYLRLKTKYE